MCKNIIDAVKTKARYTYRIYPNAVQKQVLARTFGCARYVYNWALSLRKEEPMTYGESSARLTAHKKEVSWLGEVSCVPVQQALRHLNTAFKNMNHGKGFPRFKSKKHRRTAEFTVSGFKLTSNKLQLGKIPGLVRVRWSRELPSAPSTATVILDPDGRYFVTFCVDVISVKLPATAKQVGIDLGLTDFFVTSDGLKTGNPRYFNKLERKLARAQRKLSSKTKGSRNQEKQRLRVARIYSRIRDRRKDFLDKLSSKLVQEYDLIVIEDLRVANMLKMRSLAKAISDASWSQFAGMLEYKCAWYGKTCVRVNPAYTSTTCSECGCIATSMPLHVREWTCACGAEHDRDVNAAVNILAAGQAVWRNTLPDASGGDVRPRLASAA